MGSGGDGRIRRWRAEDGLEVGMPMDVGSVFIYSLPGSVTRRKVRREWNGERSGDGMGFGDPLKSD